MRDVDVRACEEIPPAGRLEDVAANMIAAVDSAGQDEAVAAKGRVAGVTGLRGALGAWHSVGADGYVTPGPAWKLLRSNAALRGSTSRPDSFLQVVHNWLTCLVLESLNYPTNTTLLPGLPAAGEGTMITQRPA